MFRPTPGKLARSTSREHRVPPAKETERSRQDAGAPVLTGDRPTIMLTSRQNRIHPSGENMMFNNLLFFSMYSLFLVRSPEEF
jgi:hypothetical protein